MTHWHPSQSRFDFSSVAPKSVRTLLEGAWEYDQGTLAIQMVETQLANYQTRKTRNVQRDMDARFPSLSDVAADKLAESIGENADEEMKLMEGLPPNVLSRIAVRLENMTYETFCKARQLVEDDKADIDEWVLRNEVWLRNTSTTSGKYTGDSVNPDSEIVIQGIQKSDWGHGLVRLSAHADVVFPGSTISDNCRIITRPKTLPGFKILDGRRQPSIRIQPSVEAFGKKFETMTTGLLKGLNWDNIFIAGGIVLGSLLCTGDKETSNTPEQWKSSDIDMYIYGLGPVEANKKIEHIFGVFKANLPADAPVLVVRNSKTITFFSKYPLRRVQVVLKLMKSPKDVLLNFDLDICAVGWDGEEVWMLPRAARAVETGYTVFTMDLINGHYLGDRRATQEQRVFKYADKGFGIRILPSYLKELQTIKDDPIKRKALDIYDSDSHRWSRRNFEEIVEAARKCTAGFVRGFYEENEYSVPIRTSHCELQEKTQDSEDPPRRSALSGLSLFMRHVALWELEVANVVIISRGTWAAPIYDSIYFHRFGVSYNDVPDYLWNEEFTIHGLIEKINRFNQNAKEGFEENLHKLYSWSEGYESSPPPPSLEPYLVEVPLIQRVSYADSVEEILQPKCDVSLPVWIPPNFTKFLDDVIPDYVAKAIKPALQVDFPDDCTEGLQPMIWRINNITMWQQLDRTIDEVHEVLWTFHFANAGLVTIHKASRLEMLVAEFARRAIRLTAQDEIEDFARWVARKPGGFYQSFDTPCMSNAEYRLAQENAEWWL